MEKAQMRSHPRLFRSGQAEPETCACAQIVTFVPSKRVKDKPSKGSA